MDKKPTYRIAFWIWFFGLITGLIIGFCLGVGLSGGCSASPTLLPINGGAIEHKVKSDEDDHAFMLYFPWDHCPEIRIIDLQTLQDEKVPFSENRFIYIIDMIYPGFDVSRNAIGVAWCVDNNSIHYCEKNRTTGQWQYFGEIFHDNMGDWDDPNKPGYDTNRSDIAIGQNQTLVVFQSDYRIRCLRKNHGSNSFGSLQEISYPQKSEPSHPVIRYVEGDKYYVAYSKTMNGTRSIEVSRHESGNWYIDHQFGTGITDAPGIYMINNNDYMVIAILWVEEGYGYYRKVFVGKKSGPVFTENIIYEGNVALDDTHPTSSCIAMTDQNALACYVHKYPFDEKSYCQSSSNAGQSWSIPYETGDKPQTALYGHGDAMHLVYVRDGHVYYDKIGGEPTPTPSTIPSSTSTPTFTPQIPTETPTQGTTPTPTPTPDGTPLVCPTPDCLWQWGQWGIGCRW